MRNRKEGLCLSDAFSMLKSPGLDVFEFSLFHDFFTFFRQCLSFPNTASFSITFFTFISWASCLFHFHHVYIISSILYNFNGNLSSLSISSSSSIIFVTYLASAFFLLAAWVFGFLAMVPKP